MTTDFSEGGCGIRIPELFSSGARVLAKITKNGITLATPATVAYSLPPTTMGLAFVDMPSTRSSFLFAGSEPRSQRFVRMPARNDRATRPSMFFPRLGSPSSDHSRGLDLTESPVNTTRLTWTYFEVARKFACIPGVPPERHDPSLSMSTGRSDRVDLPLERDNKPFGRR